jgi:hypothetical protein
MDTLLGMPSPHTVTIVLTRSDEEYYEAAQYTIPEWSQAVVFIKEKMIYLKISSADDLLKSPQILLHEIAHIRIDEICHGNRIPVWLNEGLAQYLSGESLTLAKKILLSNAINTKNTISLTAMDSLMQFQRPQAELAYAQSLSTIDYIISKHGVNTLPQLLQAFSTNTSVDENLTTILGFDYIDFENEWFEYIYEEYRWLIILNFDNFLWFLIAVLIILAIFAVRYRNRRKLLKWDEEERAIFLEEKMADVRPEEDFPDKGSGNSS